MKMRDIDNFIEKYKKLSLPVKASLWYTICSVINKGIALISTPIFTRVMTAEQYGKFTIFQSWYAILVIFTSLNIYLGGYQKGLILFKEDKDRFTASQLGLIITITCIFGIIYLLFPAFWNDFFGLSSILMLAMFAELFFMPATELWSAQQRFDYKYKKNVAVTFFLTAFSMGVGIITVINTSHKTEARVYADMTAKSLIGITLLILLFKRGKIFYDRTYWKYALAFNIPLIPHYLSNYILNQSDRLMIGKMVGSIPAAYYSVAYTISSVILLITNAINNSLTPYIYKSIDSGERKEIKKVANLLVALVAGLCVLTMAFAPEVIYAFAGKKYMDALYVIPPVALSVLFIFIYSLFSTIEYYYQKTKLISLATCVCAILNLILNYIFIKKYGYYAAGYTTLVCYIFLAIAHYVFYCKTLKEKNISDTIYDIKIITGISIVALFLMLGMVAVYRIVIARYIIVVSMFVIALMKRKKIKDILVEVKNKDK
mgnify:FL=1